MTAYFNPARGYEAFHRIAQAVKTWALGRALPVLGYDRTHVANRLSQRIVEAGLHPFLQDAGDRFEGGEAPLPGAGEIVRCGGMSIHTASGRVTPGVKLVVNSLAEFGAQWGQALLRFGQAIFSGRRLAAVPVTVVAGVGLEGLFVDGEDTRFVDFVRRGPVPPLREATHLMVLAPGRHHSVDAGHISYARQPLFELLGARRVRLSDAISFLGNHVAAAFAYLRLTLRMPIACLLTRDFAYHAAVASLNRRGLLEAYLFTNSAYLSQPLWMRGLPGKRYSTHMIWYSQNSIPFVYKSDGVRAHIPNFSHLWADHIWVWTEPFADYLRSIGAHGELHAIGPVLWCLPERTAEPRTGDTIKLAVFDVTPQTTAFVKEVGLTYNYYREENVTRFIAGLLAVRDRLQQSSDRRIEIVLKHKRAPQRVHEKGYLDWISELARSGEIAPVSPQANLYSLISSADAVVVMPFSSPALVGADLGKPAAFFDPTGEIIHVDATDGRVAFAAGEDELERWLRSVLGLGQARGEGINAGKL